jgi:hypothetical protein
MSSLLMYKKCGGDKGSVFGTCWRGCIIMSSLLLANLKIYGKDSDLFGNGYLVLLSLIDDQFVMSIIHFSDKVPVCVQIEDLSNISVCRIKLKHSYVRSTDTYFIFFFQHNYLRSCRFCAFESYATRIFHCIRYF